MEKNKFDEKCSKELMITLKFDFQLIESCFGDTNGGGVNTVLDNEINQSKSEKEYCNPKAQGCKVSFHHLFVSIG